MKKATAENIKGSLPSLVKVLSEYLKSLFSLEGKKELVDNASGSLGFLIQLFGKPAIDNYYGKVKDRKLEDYGFHTYIEAAFSQSSRSVQHLKDSLPADLPFSERILGLQKEFVERVTTQDMKFTISVFQPKYHPGVQLIRDLVVNALELLQVEQRLVIEFRKNFNDNIEAAIATSFGDYYELHHQKIRDFMFLENETKLLMDCVDGCRIGFGKHEDLKYEDAYGYWAPVSARGRHTDYSLEDDQFQVNEGRLVAVEDLVEVYFAVQPDNHLQKILFLVADFGKGKSVFLKNYAARLAKSYLETGEGYFPVYINLRDFKTIPLHTPLGLVDDFLKTIYGIDVSADYFKRKRFVFLLDSLDESCNLSKNDLESLINSLKQIQNIDKTTVRTNRIIITSRPFDDNLFRQILDNKPHVFDNTSHYLSLYGFKRTQFNSWIRTALKKHVGATAISEKKSIVDTILKTLKENNGNADIYSILQGSGSLSHGELRRPIFAYMIYQLVINNMSVTGNGKFGVYLSFINLLTKEAKYVNDPDYTIVLKDQFKARSILHQIAALWLFEKGKGKQSMLKKADICRLVGGFSNLEDDTAVFEAYRKKGFDDIQFLSHSYFGENDSMLHFQHQSFAEMLLAEYYLKVFISFALNRTPEMSRVIPMLMVGYPTQQTIEFYKELLGLLKQTVSDDPPPEVIEKRRMLTPLLASIALMDNNRQLNSQALFIRWYEPVMKPDTSEIPESMLVNWCIDQKVLDQIIELSTRILHESGVYVLSRSAPLTALIRDEVTLLNDGQEQRLQMFSKKIALLTGNALFNDTGKYFVREVQPRVLVRLLAAKSNDWENDAYKGIRLLGADSKEKGEKLGKFLYNLELIDMDFSDAVFDGLIFLNCNFVECLFANASFHNVSFQNTLLFESDFSLARLSGVINMTTAFFATAQMMSIPVQLSSLILQRAAEKDLSGKGKVIIPASASYQVVMRFLHWFAVSRFFADTSFYFKYCFENGLLSPEELLAAFDLTDPGIANAVRAAVEGIKNAPDDTLPSQGISL